jgi:hypothetical protein
MPVKTISVSPVEPRLKDEEGLYPSVLAKWPSPYWHPVATMTGRPVNPKTITVTDAEA